MRYICLVHADPKRFEELTREQQQDLDRRSMAYDRELTEKGHYLAAEAIQDGSSAILVRVRNGVRAGRLVWLKQILFERAAQKRIIYAKKHVSGRV